MNWFGRSVRKFTAAESFRLFMEGLRSLQAYDEQATRELPSEDVLNTLLERSEEYFQQCVDNYEKDILPRYYLGIVWSMKAQVEQARSLRSQIQEGAAIQVTTDPADSLFRQAADEFARVADQVNQTQGGRDVLVYALYNQAQALAKVGPQKASKSLQNPGERGNERPWDRALLVLQKIDPELVLAKLTGWGWLKGRLRFAVGPLGFEDALNSWLIQEKPRDKKQLAEGVSVPLKAKQGESRAFEIQVRVLEYAIQLRKSIYSSQRVVVLEDLPRSEAYRTKPVRAGRDSTITPSIPLDNKSSPKDPADTIRRYISLIEKDDISSSAKQDITSDYWNKLASIAWERAVLLGEKRNGPWLVNAREYIGVALEGRPNWTPGQLTLARIEALEGNKDGAFDALELVLGRSKAPPPETTPPETAPNSQGIITLIQNMTLERDPKVIASLIHRSYGSLSQQTIGEVIAALAGKLDGKFLDEILEALQRPASA